MEKKHFKPQKHCRKLHHRHLDEFSRLYLEAACSLTQLLDTVRLSFLQMKKMNVVSSNVHYS